MRFPCPQISSEGTDAAGPKDKCQLYFNIAHSWTLYHTKLLVLAQARQWLSATE